MSHGTSGRSRYSDEFKTQAVDLYLIGGKSVAKVAGELGISMATLTNWVRMKKQTKQGSSDLSESSNDVSCLKKQILELRKTLAIVEEEALILKKCIAFFAKK